ncbi:MAG: DUF1570 domain-containing protein [Planctomycetota bacterium]|jgi:hypothetical protein
MLKTMLLVAGVLLAPLAATATAFDKVLLKDGRQVEGTILESDDPDYVRLEIKGTEIPIPLTMIDKTYVENLEGYVAKNKQEEEWLKKGYVLFEGSWMSSKRRDDELRKRADADKAYIKEARLLQDWRNAIKHETRHFEITSNLDQETIDLYADRLERYYKNFVDFWGITLSPGEIKGKPKIFLYRTPNDFHSVTGVARNIGGFFSPVNVELHLPHKLDDPEEALDVLFHEGNHLLTFMIEPTFRYPIWMNEGMAEYYGTADIDEKGNFIVGGQQDGRIVLMRKEQKDGNFRRLRDVLTTEQGQFNAYDYAYAWSFVHFLMQSDEYGKTFRGFFGNIANNRDVKVEKINAYGYDRAAIAMTDLDNVVEAFEKRMGKSLEELEEEWLEFFAQGYTELRPEAYYDAARIEFYDPKKDGSHVTNAVAFYEKAVELGIQNPRCYRDYAELLRKGGMVEAKDEATPLEPDQERAWELIQKAIELDPVQPYNYTEAAGILIMDGPLQDLDRAAALAETALALSGKRDFGARAQYEELMALIEPAREKARERAELEAALAESDRRTWHVAFYFVQGETPPDNIEDLSTFELLELIKLGKVTGRDYVFQTWQEPDPETGEAVPGENPWDLEWIAVADVPEFADALAEAEGTEGDDAEEG